jgi:hypothetical protein
MMITLTFAGFMLMAASIALVDWRRGWLMAMAVAFLQDPARKLTPGTPVIMTLSNVAIYAIVIFSAQGTLQRSFRELSRRFSGVYATGAIFAFFLVLGAFNGLFTYGIEYWKVPVLSLFIYVAPIPAVLLGYAYARDEESIVGLFRFYAVLTSIALIGTPLEYLKVNWAALGMVNLPEGFIRHLPGIQIRILSGFYRAPDIMGWHAAMLTIVGMTMALRARVARVAWPWMVVASWGFFNSLISGRRKAVYMVAVFAAAFLWRYIRRVNSSQLLSFAFVGVLMFFTIHRMGQSEESSVYARGAAATTEGEVFARLEGGVVETIGQFGFLGAGLGTATQGVHHLTGHDENIGWQEGGLGKLAIEVGLPGLLAAAVLMFVLIRTLMKITAFRDETGSTQLMRCALFGIFAANVVEFMVSAQAYSDAGLTLMTAFLLGCLLATKAMGPPAVATSPQPAQPVSLQPATA